MLQATVFFIVDKYTFKMKLKIIFPRKLHPSTEKKEKLLNNPSTTNSCFEKKIIFLSVCSIIAPQKIQQSSHFI